MNKPKPLVRHNLHLWFMSIICHLKWFSEKKQSVCVIKNDFFCPEAIFPLDFFSIWHSNSIYKTNTITEENFGPNERKGGKDFRMSQKVNVKKMFQMSVPICKFNTINLQCCSKRVSQYVSSRPWIYRAVPNECPNMSVQYHEFTVLFQMSVHIQIYICIWIVYVIVYVISIP